MNLSRWIWIGVGTWMAVDFVVNRQYRRFGVRVMIFGLLLIVLSGFLSGGWHTATDVFGSVVAVTGGGIEGWRALNQFGKPQARSQPLP